MKTKTNILFVILLVALSANQSLWADAVHTTDGSKLVGKIIRWGDDKLIIETKIAGRLEVDVSLITAIETDKPVIVELNTGDRLIGPVALGKLDDDKPGSAVHTAVGDITVPAEKIAAVWQPGADSPDVIAAKKAAEKEIKALTPQWTIELEAGAKLEEGNSDSLDARGRLDIKRKTKNDLLSIFLAFDYSEENDIRSDNEYRGGVSFENMITEKAFWYGRVGLEFDEFEDLDLRATTAAGGGYYWINKSDRFFKSRLGLGYRHESFDNGESQDEVILDSGIEYRIDIAPWLKFSHSTTYAPSLENIGDYTIDSDTAFIFPLKYEGIKLKLGMRNEYDSRPQPGIDRLDNTYYMNVVLAIVKPEP